MATCPVNHGNSAALASLMSDNPRYAEMFDVNTQSANTGIDIRMQGRSILIDFINSSVPRNLVRRLDVGDFPPPASHANARASEWWPPASHAGPSGVWPSQ